MDALVMVLGGMAGGAVAALLLGLLLASEVLAASGGRRALRARRTLWLAIGPLAAAFALMAAVRLGAAL